MTYTTEQLIEILDEELRANWKGKRIVLSSEERLNNPVIAKAMDMRKISKVFAYQDFRLQIHEYQREHQVSGIIWRECNFLDRSVRFPEIHDQLIAIDSDKPILRNAKQAVLAFWHQVTKGMNYFLAGDPPEKTTEEMINQWESQTEWADVDATRSEVYLGLCWGNPKECHCQWAKPHSGCYRIIATHTEPSLIKVY